MVQNAGLMFGDASSSFILAYMLTMARQKDGRVSIQQTLIPGSNIIGRVRQMVCCVKQIVFGDLLLLPLSLPSVG